MGIAHSRGRLALAMVLTLLLCLRFDSSLTILPLLTAILGAMGIREFHRMARLQDAPFSRPIAILLGFAIVVMGRLPLEDFVNLFPVVITFSDIFLFTIQMNRFGIPGALTGMAAGAFSLVYVAAPLALALQVLQMDRLFLFFGLVLIWSADSGAYFVGRKFGRHKMAPNLSPKKTVEGLLGGVLVCCLMSWIFTLITPAGSFDYPLSHLLVLGGLIGILAPIGDLAESVLKRDAGVKDSGTGLGGHGGALDRIDSMLFCMPAYYAYLRFLAD